MLVSIKWLRELVDLEGISDQEVVDSMALYSTEIESTYQLVPSSGLVVGHIVECIPHPSSTHLHVCRVDIKTEILSIVCGAANVALDQYVIVAPIGATLANGLNIAEVTLRGVLSSGMICSLQEIGIEKKYIEERYAQGIYWFSTPKEIGSDAVKALSMDGLIMELGITPNRADLLSMIGVAKEVSAIFHRKTMLPLMKEPTFVEGKSSQLSVSIKSDDCSTYIGQRIRNVSIKSSPEWLISRLIAFGIRPINNVVDITNYILALYGQPLHAFDAQKLGASIEVRKAKNRETMTTLDEVVRELDEEDLLITDGHKAIALAGVMGGLDTEVSNNTKDIVLEAALFHPKTIRKTSLKLQLRSESSLRFERGIDPTLPKRAVAHANYLFEELTGATIDEPAVIVHNFATKTVVIALEKKRVQELLGIDIAKETIEGLLQRIGCTLTNNQEHWLVYPPSHRLDLQIPEDLVEEVGRLYGYHNLTSTLPSAAFVGGYSNSQLRQRKIKRLLLGMGLQEIITYSLVDKKANNTCTLLYQELEKEVPVLMPLSAEHAYLRRSLLPSIVEVVRYHYARNTDQIRFFEIGKTYSISGSETVEKIHAMIAISGSDDGVLWKEKQKSDFYRLKGIVQALFSELNVEVDFVPLEENAMPLHPKRSAKILVEGTYVGYIGGLHPLYEKQEEINDVYVAEIILDQVVQKEISITKFKTLSKVQNIKRDIAVVVKKHIAAKQLIDTITNSNVSLLDDVEIFDVYEGENVESDEKSIAIRLTFSSYEPMTDDMIQQSIHILVEEMEKKLNAKLR